MKASVQHAAMPSITDFHTTNTHLDGFDGLAPAKRTNKQLQTERSAKKRIFTCSDFSTAYTFWKP
jgi:hypothetical protein